jgi:hypothetical protein
MSNCSVLFQWLNIDWTLTLCVAAAGVLLMLGGVGLFMILFKHAKGKVERMSEQETRDYMNYGELTEPYGVARTMQSVGPVIGFKAVLTANIDTLRKAARRGDRLTFWLWPSMMSCWCIGLSMLLIAALPHDPILIVLTSLVPTFMVFVAWFMPWAAIHTSIDLNADAEPPSQAGGRAHPPQE